MATWDFGGGCACGVSRWCDCGGWSQMDSRDNYELFERRMSAGEAPPEDVFNPVLWKFDQQKAQTMKVTLPNRKKEIKIKAVFKWMYNQDTQCDELRQKDMDNIVAFIAHAIDPTVRDPLACGIYIAFVIEGDGNAHSLLDWRDNSEYHDLKSAIEEDIRDRCPEDVEVIFEGELG